MNKLDMKNQVLKLLMVVSFAIVSITALAQYPVITATNQIPQIGDVIQISDANTFGFDPSGGSTGVIDVVWDFSNLISTAIYEHSYVDPTATAQSAIYPTATVAQASTQLAGYAYWENGTDYKAILGLAGAQAIIYTTPVVKEVFPITPGISWSTMGYTGVLTGLNAGEDSTTIVNGNYLGTPDAFGTVILPPLTFGGDPEVFENVVRVHVTESFQILVWIFGTPLMTVNVNDDYYYWFHEETLEPILTNGTTTDDAGGAPQTTLSYQLISGTPVVSGCATDLNGDGVTTVQDLLLVLSEFGCNTSCTADINGDGFVTVADILLILGAFGVGC